MLSLCEFGFSVEVVMPVLRRPRVEVGSPVLMSWTVKTNPNVRDARQTNDRRLSTAAAADGRHARPRHSQDSRFVRYVVIWTE